MTILHVRCVLVCPFHCWRCEWSLVHPSCYSVSLCHLHHPYQCGLRPHTAVALLNALHYLQHSVFLRPTHHLRLVPVHAAGWVHQAPHSSPHWRAREMSCSVVSIRCLPHSNCLRRSSSSQTASVAGWSWTGQEKTCSKLLPPHSHCFPGVCALISAKQLLRCPLLETLPSLCLG